ncbi:DUF305 domain-containing protein [Saccharothrix variisporea]|uniref:Uncharacterized protein (DUF305 family) n=1 Tax=Saccharothrix variisporea TaxID=543527 RepID=A0A495X960_9PSEU|nr:DUF305 domain-containing protein [Saccharothrix variisporea]RKT69143.1 uncharacterized protein (DUF305 family) [Saccharothrix variisporea]
MTRKTLVGTTLAVLTAITLAGCSNNPGNSHNPSTTKTTTATSSNERNDADITFAQDMIPHHVGALDMAKLAQGRTTNPKVLDLATRIEKAQAPEIKTMTEWLKTWGAEAPGTHHGTAGHDMDPTESEKLKQAKDTEFDMMFLAMMIKHHQGAIDMANTELRQGRNAEAKQLAQRIIDAQQAEIEEMKDLLPAG